MHSNEFVDDRPALPTDNNLITTADLEADFITGELATSVDFYRARGAASIMRTAHFPDDLFFFLQLESLAILQTVREYRCDVLVEMGCYDGRALEVARSAEVSYLGVDINDRAVELLRRRIVTEGLQQSANAVVGDVRSPSQWIGAVAGNVPLYVFPFNLVGNLPDPAGMFASLSDCNGYGIVTVFNSDVWTTEIRRDYYLACGIKLSDIEQAPYGGVLFRGGDGFTSQSYSSDCMDRFLKDCGLQAVSSARNRIGQCVTFRFT